jgi:hypothetical protein
VDCRRTGRFQLVFTETQLAPELELAVGRHADPEWQAAIKLLLGALAAQRDGVAAANLSWQNLMMWLQDGEQLETFIRRALQSIDAAIWILAVAADGLAQEHGDDGLERIRHAALDELIRE